jgi:cytochrome c oxidase assembly protein Cox11
MGKNQIRDPGWEKTRSGIGTNQIRDRNKPDPGSGMGKNQIRDKHPGSYFRENNCFCFKNT